MPEPKGLDGVIQQKVEQEVGLKLKLDFLQGPKVQTVNISYSMVMSMDEQIRYAKLGLYHLYRDLNGYNEVYK